MAVDLDTSRRLVQYAEMYETAAFLEGDPSCFMHMVSGPANQEATAFVASCLSFGSRSQFLPKIQGLLDCASGDMDRWVRSGGFERDVPPDPSRCFYRFFTFEAMNAFLRAYRDVMAEHGTLGAFVEKEAGGDGARAVAAVCRCFAERAGGVVPKAGQSACKRICMFLRWMVRGPSPVDLGLWARFIDRRTLVIPLDTHVVQEACALGLLKSRCASMCAARRLTAALSEVFPEDPCRGDFALFGYGVNKAQPHVQAEEVKA